MSLEAMTQYDALRRSVRTRSASDVLFSIANHYSKERIAWLSHSTLAEECNVSERQIIRAIQELIDGGFIVTEPGNGRGNATLFHIPAVDALPLKGDIGVSVSQPERVTSVTVKGDIRDTEPPERVTSRVRKGDTYVTPTIRNQEDVNQELTRDETRPPAREEVPEVSVKPKRTNPDTPHGRLTAYALERWPLKFESMANARQRITQDLSLLLEKCGDNDAEAIAALKAFSAGVEGGGRPDYRFVIRYLDRWRGANRPESFHPFNQPRKELTHADKLSTSSGAAGPFRSEDDRRADWDDDIRFAEQLDAKRENRSVILDMRPTA